MNTTTYARAVCCGATCRSPNDCAAADTTRVHPIDIHTAARNVQAAMPGLLCDAWRAERGPMSRTTRVGGE